MHSGGPGARRQTSKGRRKPLPATPCGSRS